MDVNRNRKKNVRAKPAKTTAKATTANTENMSWSVLHAFASCLRFNGVTTGLFIDEEPPGHNFSRNMRHNLDSKAVISIMRDGNQLFRQATMGALRVSKSYPLIAFASSNIQLAKAIHGRVLPTGIAISSITIEKSPALKVAR